MDLEKNKQRLEILAAEVEELKNSSGETVDAYTKEEADDKFAEKATTYTKTEVDEAIASAAGGDVIVSGEDVKTKNANANARGILIGNNAGFDAHPHSEKQIAIGVNAGAFKIDSGDNPISIGYQARARKKGVVIGANSFDYGGNSVIVGYGLEAGANNQILLGRFNKTSNEQDYFAVGNGTNNNDNARSNLFSFSNNLFYCGNDTTGYDLRYFAPADETLTNGGTISATALANANKHVPLSFNAYMCYYSYEDTDNVYYVSIRLKGDALHTKVLHTNVIAINKKYGVATFNEFDRS